MQWLMRSTFGQADEAIRGPCRLSDGLQEEVQC